MASLAAKPALLAEISHDVRRPLMRTRLALAMLPEELPDRAEMERDIGETERLTKLYSEFAPGKGEEQPVAMNVPLLTSIAWDRGNEIVARRG